MCARILTAPNTVGGREEVLTQRADAFFLRTQGRHKGIQACSQWADTGALIFRALLVHEALRMLQVSDQVLVSALSGWGNDQHQGVGRTGFGRRQP